MINAWGGSWAYYYLGSYAPINAWYGEHYKASNLWITMEECGESGEDVLGNTVWVLRDWGQYHPEPRRPQAERGRVVLPPISKDEDGIPQYVRARLTVLTLLFDKLEPTLSSEIYLPYFSKQ